MTVLIIITMLIAFAVMMTQTWFIEKKEREHKIEIGMRTAENFIALRNFQDLWEEYHQMMSMAEDTNWKVRKVLLGNATEEEVSEVNELLAEWTVKFLDHNKEYDLVKNSIREMITGYRRECGCEDDSCEE